MVYSGNRTGAGEAVVEEEDMERLMPLHNFDLPYLKWGEQKLLRCIKVDSNGEASAVDRKQSSDSGGGGGVGSIIGTRRRRYRFSDHQNMESLASSEKMKARAVAAGDGEIEATREKLMFDFQTEIGKMKDAILREGLVVSPPPATTSTSPAEQLWNLRTRRAPSNGVNVNGNLPKPNPSPARNERKSTAGQKRENTKLSVSLSRREVEEDFTAMAGRRLPRKPKKRPRIVQKQLDTLFPGLWLTEITADLYKVPDETEPPKR